MRILESTIERKVVAAAKKMGVPSIKLNGRGVRGVPDRLFLLPDGHPVFVEFKTPKGRLSATQKWWLSVLGGLGYTVAVEVNADDCIRHLAVMLKG